MAGCVSAVEPISADKVSDKLQKKMSTLTELQKQSSMDTAFNKLIKSESFFTKSPESCAAVDEFNAMIEEIKDQKDNGQIPSANNEKSRGFSSFTAATIELQNFLLMWGCRPSSAVNANTKMIAEIVNVLLTKLDRNTLTIQLPQAFEHLKGEDANFEMVTSNTIQ